MAIRTMLAVLNGQPGDAHILDGAWSLAERVQAHLVVSRFGPNVPTLLDSAVILPPESASQSARAHFAAWCAAHAPFMAELPSGTPRASLDPDFVTETNPNEMAARMRLADLVIMERPQGWLDDTGASLHYALFEAGRPALLLPPDREQLAADKIVIAWNGSEPAARAVAFALPLLAAAKSVQVFDRAEQSDIRAGRGPAELVAHLHWHGIAATEVTDYHRDSSIGADLLRSCKHVRADMLVMGAYNHGRLREFLFGGVTRHILAEAALPVMMVH